MDDLNEFQKSCEEALTHLLKEHGIPTQNEKVNKNIIFGNEESYIEGNVLDNKFWIYEDGAEIQTQNDEFRLEKEDFDSPEELQKEFLAIFKNLLTSKD